MIVKILDSASNNFNAVRYNDKKMEEGKGELMLLKNFPSFIRKDSNQNDIKKYLQTISANGKVKKPQFHATISTKFREHSKSELAEIGEKFMDKFGYENQPYLIIFHNDTENNHIHLVSTRVDKNTSKKIDDSFEKLKSQRVLSQVMEEKYGISSKSKLEELLQYKFSSIHQLGLLLEKSGFKFLEKENKISISKNGINLKSLAKEKLEFNKELDKKRVRQIKAFINKYKEVYSNKVFKVVDDRKEKGLFKLKSDKKHNVEFHSELQKKLKDMFGIEIAFHSKDFKTPFGYTLIDNKTGQVFKGSQILKMNEVFEFTSNEIDKKLFERLKDFNVKSDIEKDLLMKAYPNIQRFMLFENKKKKPLKVYNQIRNEVKDFLKGGSSDGIFILKGEDGKEYVVNENYHHVEDLENLVGENFYERFKNDELTITKEKVNTESITDILLRGSYTEKDPWENKLKKRKKRKKR